MTEEEKYKRKVRSSSKWKKFRAWIKKTRKVDEVTGKPLIKGWQLHHMDMSLEHYDDLTCPENFSCLNKTSHKVVHWLFRYDNWQEILKNLYMVLIKMEQLNNK